MMDSGSNKPLLAETFGPEGAFAQVFANFEVRNEQVQMAIAVEQAFLKSQHLLVEAGTGIGKSLAYLVPAVHWARTTGHKVVISTHTKILQNQLIKKDIPLLEQALGTGLKAEPVFGQENYLCLRRLNAVVSYGLFDSPRMPQEIDDVMEWARTSDGLLVNYPDAIDPRTLSRVGRNSDTCLFQTCPHQEECFYFQARHRWQQADLLVINHYLYFANAEASDHLLPGFDAVVFDEAHRLEDVCARFFGADLSNTGLERLLNSIHNPKHRRGLIQRLPCPAGLRRHIDDLLQNCSELSRRFFSGIASRLPQGANRLRIRQAGIAENLLEQPLKELQGALKELATEQDDEELATEVKSLMKGTERHRGAVALFLDPNDKNSVYWVELEGKDRVHLRSAMIDVAEQFRTEVFDKRATVVLTSATLTANRSFDFIVDRLGARPAKTLLLDSPFDYPKQALLFVDQRLPPPTQGEAFAAAAARAVDEILGHSQGRALVLFTSYDLLQRVYQSVRKDRFQFYAQGEASTYELLQRFKQDVHSVLFATQSFWEGVDVPGEALSCLIITRLPFEVPDDPRLEGIAESLRDQGREPFTEYQLPQAVLRFRQGFGRLIRNKTDLGVVCVLDNRITQRAYGRMFINSLPKDLSLVNNPNFISQFLRPPAQQ